MFIARYFLLRPIRLFANERHWSLFIATLMLFKYCQVNDRAFTLIQVQLGATIYVLCSLLLNVAKIS